MKSNKVHNPAETLGYFVLSVHNCSMESIDIRGQLGATSYFHPNHLGSTSVIIDSAGNSEQDLAYYPYGDTFLNVGSKDVKFKYTGKEKDDSTGLYFYEARYYDPFLALFISPQKKEARSL